MFSGGTDLPPGAPAWADVLQLAAALVVVVSTALGVWLRGYAASRDLGVLFRALWQRFGFFSVAGLAAIVWLTIVALKDKDGFTGQTAAAWVQGIGSVAAIFAAIAIDQRAAARLRKDREAEWAKQREEREAAARDLRRSRVEAVRNCLLAVRSLALEVASLPLVPDDAAYLPRSTTRSFYASQTALNFRLQRPGDVDADIMALMALADATMNRVTTLPRLRVGYLTDLDRFADYEVIVQARDDLDELIEQYDQGVL